MNYASAGINVENALYLAIKNLVGESQLLVTIKDTANIRKLDRKVKGIFTHIKELARIAGASPLLSFYDPQISEVYININQVISTVEKRKLALGRGWWKVVHVLKEMIDFIADLTNIAPLAILGVLVLLPSAAYIAPFIAGHTAAYVVAHTAAYIAGHTAAYATGHTAAQLMELIKAY